jgi:septum formation protein
LLTQAGYAFEVRAADGDESLRVGESATEYVERLAVEKARSVAATLTPTSQEREVGHPDSWLVVIGADTTVVLEGELLAKPEDRADAERMLRRLSGKTHQVHTGIAVVRGEVCLSQVETTNVTFREIGEEELGVYLESGDAMDKAGAYGIQGYAARWVPRIEGDYFNVVGLPVSAVVGLLERIRE